MSQSDAKNRDGSQIVLKLLELKAGLEKQPDERSRRAQFVNLIARLVPCDQAVLWVGGKTPVAASGVRDIDRNAPHIQDLKKYYAEHLRHLTEGAVLPPERLEEVPSFAGSGGGLYQPLRGAEGGILLVRGQGAYQSAHLAVLNLALSVATGELLTHAGRWHKIKKSVRSPALFLAALIGFLALASLIPVSQTILSPIEVVSTDVTYVKSPANGVIDEVFVEPGNLVGEGDPILFLDVAQLQSQLEIAQAEHNQLRVEYEQETIKSLSEATSRFRLAEIQAGLSEKVAQIAFLSNQIADNRLYATRSGVVSMPEIEQLRGRPVSVGDTLLTIADPEKLEVELWLPLQTALPVSAGDAVTVFMNSNPVSPYTATVRYVTTQPQSRPDGSMGYRGRADAVGPLPGRVLGQRGMGRITTGRETLFMKLLRQPIAWIRQSVGI